jgi:hypothetical protein
MKRFMITSPRFTGAAEVIYNAAGLLILIDFTNVVMTVEQLNYFKMKVPSNLATENLADAFNKGSVTVIMADVEITFAMFWVKYDKKINKKRCEDFWNRMRQDEKVLAYVGIDPYNKYLKNIGWRSKADPDTYLRNKYFENEYK